LALNSKVILLLKDTGMKTTISYLIALLLFITACQKEECVTPEPSPTATQKVWHLSMQIPSLYVDFNADDSAVETLFGNNNVAVGNYITFESARDSVIVGISRLNDGTTAQLTGALRGHTFIMVDNKLNICDGKQQVPFDYQLNP